MGAGGKRFSQPDHNGLILAPPMAFSLANTGPGANGKMFGDAQGNLPVCAVRLTPDTIAIGTYLAGAVVATTDDHVQSIIDHARGLPNDNVHALWRDPRGTLWIGSRADSCRSKDWVTPPSRRPRRPG